MKDKNKCYLLSLTRPDGFFQLTRVLGVGITISSYTHVYMVDQYSVETPFVENSKEVNIICERIKPQIEAVKLIIVQHSFE